MALGKRKAEQQEALFVTAAELPKAPGHVFYRKLNRLLAEGGFDAWAEKLCEPYYADGRGRPGIPPGIYFRMLLVGYFEGIGSQRGIAWRCSDSLSLREFLGIPLAEESPDHSSLSVIRNRLPFEVHAEVLVWVLRLAQEKKLLKGQTIGVDSTTLEANAAMKSIVRRETGEDWKEYLTRLMQEEGLIDEGDEPPSDDQLRRFDKQRKNKKVSNDEWVSETDPDSRIARMKDGTTHLAYKAEHAVDLETEMIVAAEIYHADQADTQTLEDSVQQAQTNLIEAGSDTLIREVPADKGYHSAATLAAFRQHTPYRTYIPEPERDHDCRWTDKPPEHKEAVYANRRRTRGARGKQLQRLRSERVERSFAHVCETGGARRTWLWGIDKVRKRYQIAAAAHNLGIVMRKLFGIGTPRGLQVFGDLALALYLAILTLLWRLRNRTLASAPEPTAPMLVPAAA
jgi:IS5 family transposase